MKCKFMLIFYLIFLSYINCQRENDKLYEALDVPSGCVFKHTLTDTVICNTAKEWKIKAENLCLLDKNKTNHQLFEFKGIFSCPGNGQTFKAIQFVCCPKQGIYDWYITHLNNNNGTVKLESHIFQLAKKSLRDDFKLRQKVIQDRYVEEENSINIWSKYPKLAAFLETKIQNRFKKAFMSEMHKEVGLLRELEIVHENRMQKLFEKNRENAKARLKYTLQETHPEVNRIAEALKLELKSILEEAEDITNFYEVLINEDIDHTKRNKELIRENFNSLIIQSWDEIIELLNKVPNFKNDILKQITSYNLKKQIVIKHFHYLDNDYLPRNSMENQAKNYVNNIISLYGHGQVKKNFKGNFEELKLQKEKSVVSQIVMICLLFLSIILLMTLSLLLYRFHGKINSYISNTFKKIHPPTKNLFVQIENYPFKNRYNYGNGIYRPYFKSEESIIGNPNSVYNQHFSSATNSSNDGLKKSVESDYKESTISNINGLENPICRLLDEK